MITNELQYRVTKSEAQKFVNAIEGLKQQPLGKADPILRQAQINAMQSQIEEMYNDLADYEALKQQKHTEFSTHSILELPLGLIQARIVQGLTQEQLAKKLGVSKQLVQRDEENLYASASLQRLEKVAEALGVRFDGRLELI